MKRGRKGPFLRYMIFLPVLPRGEMIEFHKHPVEGDGTAKPAGLRNIFNRLITVCKKCRGMFETDRFDVVIKVLMEVI